MQSMIDKIRNLLGYGGNFPDIVTTKRDRADEQEQDYSDDEIPSFKRMRGLSNTRFPRHTSIFDEDDWEHPTKAPSKVRIVPIQVEGYPNTSTPRDGVGPSDRCRIRAGGRLLGAGNMRVHHSRAVSPKQALRIVDDDPELQISWIEPKAKTPNQDTYVLIDDDDEDEQDENDADVIYVKKVVNPQRNRITRDRLISDSPRQYITKNRLDYREQSPRAKFKSPVGISKQYRTKQIPQVAKWLQPIRSTTLGQLPLRNRFSQMNGNQRSAIMEAFNLEEKRNYRDLIKKMSEHTKQASPITRSAEVIDLANDYHNQRETQRQQKLSLSDLNWTADRLNKMNEDIQKDKEYDPITIASINSSDSEVEIVANSSSASTSSSIRIQPVNSLKSSLKDCSFMDPHWVSNLSSRYRKKIQDKTAKSCDVAKEVSLIGEINREQSIAQLQRNLKHDLKLTDDTELEEEPVVEIPQLTPEQEKLVDRALGPGPSGQVFIEKFNLQIHRRDLQTLAGLNWLNDEVINFYMNLIMERSEERTDLPTVYAANTFFYPKLIQGGQAGLRRWTRKVDVFSKELLVIPVHLDVHWCMCLVEMDKKRVLYLDSMGGRNQRCLDSVLQYLRDEHQDKKGKPFDDGGWKREQLKNIPQQMNGSDCGMFACTFAEYASRRAKFTFSQADMPTLRRKLAYEILKGKLLL